MTKRLLCCAVLVLRADALLAPGPSKAQRMARGLPRVVLESPGAPPQNAAQRPLVVEKRRRPLARGDVAGAKGLTAPSEARSWWRVLKDRVYINLTGQPFPLSPLFARRTTLETIVPGRVWGLEQEQSLIGIRVNTRMVVVKLRNGDLWCYNPIAPTREMVALLDSLPGRVAHVVLGTTQYEHKIFCGPFSRRYPSATVHCVPEQFSFPVDLPPRLLGIAPTRQVKAGPGVLEEGASYAWSDELEIKIMRPQKRLAGNYAAVEAAFVHRDTKTLILTDALVNVPAKPPKVLDDPGLEYLGRSDSWVLSAAALFDWRGQGDALRDAVRRQENPKNNGWKRNALLALTFGPSPASLVDPSPAFDRLAAGGWFVAPVMANLVYASPVVRQALHSWVDDVARLDFVRVAPSHFAVAKCSPAQFKQAFDPVLFGSDAQGSGQKLTMRPTLFKPLTLRRVAPVVPDDDVRLIGDLANTLRRFNVI